MDNKNFIAARIAQDLQDGDVVNLGIGLPTLIANHIPEGVNVVFQSENGIFGLGANAVPGKEDPNCINSGGAYVTTVPGAMYINSADSFACIRGGHVNMTVLGALQVDEKGNLANWMVPGKKIPGMGGAMDLVSGAKKVIVAMEHTAKGNPKIFKECTFPLTGKQVVTQIVTEMCVLDVTPKGLVMTELNPKYTIKDVMDATACDVIVADDLKDMVVPEE